MSPCKASDIFLQCQTNFNFRDIFNKNKGADRSGWGACGTCGGEEKCMQIFSGKPK
jgi:hypothetical protein